jgi:hypothetical protein
MSSRANRTGLISAGAPLIPLVAFVATRGIPFAQLGVFWPAFAFYACVAPIIFISTRDREELRLLTKKNEGERGAG